MFLAGKVEETHRPIREVIVFSYHIRFRIDPLAKERIEQKEVIEEQKELVLAGERLVLTTLGFDLNIHHPYKPLVAAIKRFKAQKTLAQVAWNFVNDSLRTSLCLQFKPHHIAAGAIFLAAKFLKVNLPEEGDKVWWQGFDVTPRQLEEVSNQMLELYEQNRTNGATGPLANELSPSELDRGHAPVSSIQAPSANGNRHQQSVSGIFQPVETNANEVSSCEVEDNTVGTLRSSSTPNQSSNARRKCTPEPPGGQNLNGDEAGDNC
ncbi:cyclin-T1-3 isoform X3 [Physcomitrium patens]|nr:cyclin-T1-3-like isoform X5 [Physcomitrium patens]XP_024368413.1 cyclin-T1-3-like isoform X5 [Physcomitrium patens]|eukprot:XP_024368412.1 cyclin-T1-3-like isoform X5 [Physcomitrella patens]